MEVLQEYLVPTVVALCYCIGFIVKKWIKDVDNKWIPTICAIVGVLLNAWICGQITPAIILGGMASGLGATGLNQLIRTNETTKTGE